MIEILNSDLLYILLSTPFAIMSAYKAAKVEVNKKKIENNNKKNISICIMTIIYSIVFIFITIMFLILVRYIMNVM